MNSGMKNMKKTLKKVQTLVVFCSIIFFSNNMLSKPVYMQIDFSLNPNILGESGNIMTTINSEFPGGDRYLRLRIVGITWKDDNGEKCAPDDLNPIDSNKQPLIFTSTLLTHNFVKVFDNLTKPCYLNRIDFISQIWDKNEAATNTVTVSHYSPALPPWQAQRPDEIITNTTHFETGFSYEHSKSYGIGTPYCNLQDGCIGNYQMSLRQNFFDSPCYDLVINGVMHPSIRSINNPNLQSLLQSTIKGYSYKLIGGQPCPLFNKYHEYRGT